MKQLKNRWATNWEDDPERIEYQNWLHNLPKKYDERSARHNGLIGVGAELKQIIKDYNEQHNTNPRPR